MPDQEFQEIDYAAHQKTDAISGSKIGQEKDFDEITALAAQFCDAPIAVIYFIENGNCRPKFVFGISEDDVPCDEVFWKPVLQENKILVVPDIGKDRRFEEYPNEKEYVFYAGVPLFSIEGNAIGVLFLLDFEPHILNEKQKNTLKVLANQIINLLAYRKQNEELQLVQSKLKQKYQELEKFASVVSHDIKSPLANIISLTELLKEENKDKFNEETRQYVDFLMQSSHSLRNYVDGILSFYRSDHILEKEKEDVELPSFFKNITDLFQINMDVEISYPHSGVLENVNKAALTQIFLNLISNALKYNSKEHRVVEILFEEKDLFYEFQVNDNGDGILQKDFDKIFQLFTTLDLNDRDGHSGSGIGLATVKKLLDHMGGSIQLESEIHEGSNFKIKIQRK